MYPPTLRSDARAQPAPHPTPPLSGAILPPAGRRWWHVAGGMAAGRVLTTSDLNAVVWWSVAVPWRAVGRTLSLPPGMLGGRDTGRTRR